MREKRQQRGPTPLIQDRAQGSFRFYTSDDMQASHHVLSLVALKLYLAKHLPIDFTKKFNFLVRDKSDGPSYIKLDAGRELSQKLSPLVTEDDVTAIQTSFSVTDGLRQLRTRKWSLSDLQYVFLAAMTIGSLWIIEPAAPFLKTLAFLGFVLLLSTPATNQFFLPSWPIWAYLLFFFSSRYVTFCDPLATCSPTMGVSAAVRRLKWAVKRWTSC